ncbi:MAG: outer membrane lipoprotein carrier protein LolA [Bdellovibrionaceae bacterium]|jgi:hypothetical protein|nr:outer membrane lipoprotein carrier protein LolA [Pseudobdellovibrionaceae bacterium]
MTGRLGIMGARSFCFILIIYYSTVVRALGTDSGIKNPLKSAAAHKSRSANSIQISSFGRLSGRFHQNKVLKELDVKIQTSGQFHINRPDSENTIVHWNLEKPKKSQICIDKEGLVIDAMTGAASGKKRMNFSEVGREAGDQIVSLTKLMTMDFRDAEKDFLIEKKGKVFILKPINEKASFFESAELELNPEGFIKNIEIKEKSQDEINIQFSGFKVSQSLKGEKCIF